MNMKRIVLTSLTALPLVLAGQAHGGVVGSKHDLTTNTGILATSVQSDTDNVCVFCHTPHAGDNTMAPLWNKRDPGTAYTAYSSTTIDGGTDLNAGVSLACLTCHDGTQAMDNLLNATGSGNYDVTGGGAGGLAYTWTGTDLVTGVALLGADLSNDHPVGIQYAGGGYDDTDPTATADTLMGDPDFVKDAGLLANAVVNGTRRWWIDDDAAGDMDSTEIRLYTRTVAALANDPEPFVECASCHDPHNSTTATFLRKSNAASAVCVSCHVK